MADRQPGQALGERAGVAVPADAHAARSRVLVAGVGNIFLADDGFGVEVARRLAGIGLPDWVRVADYGISGVHLAYDMAEGYETTILVDATARGEEPGTVTVLDVDPGDPPDRTGPRPDGEAHGSPLLDAHGMRPDVVFGVLDMLGAPAGRVLVVGCEPAELDHRIGLSEPVAAAVDQAVRVVTDLIAAVRTGRGRDGPASGRSSPPDAADGRDGNGEGVSHVPRHTR